MPLKRMPYYRWHFCYDRFYGSAGPGKNSAVGHPSILVRPHQNGLGGRPSDCGGAAGYCPRVRDG